MIKEYMLIFRTKINVIHSFIAPKEKKAILRFRHDSCIHIAKMC